MVFSRICDILHIADRYPRINELVIFGDEVVPFMIFGHRDRTSSKLFHGVVRIIGFSLENASVCIVRFLNLTHDDGFQLTTRVFEIQICLYLVSARQPIGFPRRSVLGANNFLPRPASQSVDRYAT